MFDLASANHRFSRYMVSLQECSNIRNIRTENISIRSLNLSESFEGRKESAPEHVATILSIADGIETALFLDLDDVFDGLIFNCW